MAKLSFSQFQSDFFQFSQSGKYEDARLLIQLLGGLFPEHANVIYNWRVRLAALDHQPDQALNILQEALDLGLWWPEAELREDPNLADLQSLPDFQRMVAVFSERHAQALAKSSPEILLYKPDDLAEEAYPLLLVLHGRVGNARLEAEYWQGLTNQGWLVALAQSSQVLAANAFGWDDPSRARQDILDLMELLLDKQPIDLSRIVLGGFSQGAGMAILLSLESSLPARGFIAVSPSIRGYEDHFQSNVFFPQRSPDSTTLRGYLITGGQDYRQDMFQQITRTLADRGVTYQHEDDPDLGHEYPDNFPASLNRAIQFILD